MSKKSKLKLSKKQPESSPKVSTVSENSEKNTELKNPQSPPENISVAPSIDFQNAVHESKAAIQAHDEQKSQRGRKKLPRDADGNIIRPANPAAAPGMPGAQAQPLNQASVAETKAMLLGLLLPVAEGAAVKYALGDEKAKIPQEQKEPWAQATAEEIESWFPGISSKYLRLGTVIGFPVMWYINAKNIRIERIAEIEKAEEAKKKLQKDGQLATESV